MNDRGRLEQLQVLTARLEQMPATAERDWMLTEVRSRAVDIDTGVAPAPIRALPRDETEGRPADVRPARVKAMAPVARAKPSRRPGLLRTVALVPRAIAADPPLRLEPLRADARQEHASAAVNLLEEGVELCLDDQPGTTAGLSRPWSGGLRG